MATALRVDQGMFIALTSRDSLVEAPPVGYRCEAAGILGRK
jgi:hypothetical protein